MADEIPKLSFLEKLTSFAKSMKSRGLNNKMAHEKIIRLRNLSCNGDEDSIEPCPRRKASRKHKDRFICGACGCGDKPRNFLNGDGYLKIYYPTVSCPLEMPGFTNGSRAKENENRKLRVEKEAIGWYNKRSENKQ